MKTKQQSYSHRLLLLITSLVLSVLFVSCAKPDERRFVPHPALAEIDSLLWSHPDSAFVELHRFAESHDVESLEVYDGHYFQLLLSELLYKNDYAQTNREELLQAMGYFDSLVMADAHGAFYKDARGAFLQQGRNAFLDARCHYINGVGYYETDSVVPACEQYLKAVELMRDRFNEKELVGKKAQFMALAYTHLVELFSDQYLHEQALGLGKQSLLFYTKYDAEPWHIAWALDKIGLNYELLDQLDSAACYYHQAAFVLDDTTLLMYRDIVTHQVWIDYKTGMAFHTTLSLLRDLASRAETEYERMARCALMGEVYYHEAIYDSAIVYLDSVFHQSTNTGLKRQAAVWLIEINDTQHNQINVTEHTAFIVPFANTNENSGFIKSQLTNLYHNNVQQILEAAHQEEDVKLKDWIEVLLIVLFLIILLLVLFSQVNKRKQKQFVEKIMMTKAELQMKEEQHIAALGKTSDTIQTKVPKEEYDALLEERICLNIQLKIKKAKVFSSFDVKDYPSLALSSRENTELIQAIEKHCPSFSQKLKQLFPTLNSNDIQLCRFYLLNLSIIQVAILLGTDYSSVRKRTKRLKEKTNTEEINLKLKSVLFEFE